MRTPLALGIVIAVAVVLGQLGDADAQRRRRVRPGRTAHGAPALHVVQQVRTGVQPKSVEVSPDGRFVWVCNFGRAGADNVFVYDAETLAHVGTVAFEGNAVETAFNADGSIAYVSNFRRGVVEVVDTSTYAVTHEIEVGANPKFMVVSPDGARLYVALYSQQRVAIVDLATRTVTRRIRTGRQPRGMAMRPDGSVLIASFRGDMIQLVDADGDEQKRFDTCPYPRHLQLDPNDPDRVFVTCTLNSIGVYDVARGRRVLISPTGRNPRSLGLSRDGRWAATANFHGSDVSLLDAANRTHRTSEVPGADQLVGLAVHATDTRLRVFATSWNNATLFVLEPRGALPAPPAPAAATPSE